MVASEVAFDQKRIDTALVASLIATQFPQWASLPITPAVPQGWDNRTFRLGDTLSVRLPSAAGYTPQVEKEHRWLPLLAPRLPLPIPVPLAVGSPAAGYPWHWSVYRWLAGEAASLERIADLSTFAIDLACFLSALQQIDATDGPSAGPHSFFRGGALETYDAETRRTLAALHGMIETDAAATVWEAALATPWRRSPVWVHGDVAIGNLLINEGQLCAVIDFGCSAVGDPACDTVIAWTLLRGESREVFRAALPLDRATWARGRGWALWKALITLAEYHTTDPGKAAEARRVLEEVIADHKADRQSGA